MVGEKNSRTQEKNLYLKKSESLQDNFFYIATHMIVKLTANIPIEYQERSRRKYKLLQTHFHVRTIIYLNQKIAR